MQNKPMYVKVFEQILDSSIADNYEVRHFFEDMLKLADKTGVVDMTPAAISRRINLKPVEKVIELLGELAKPDADSRTPEHEGRRIIALDSHRDWGWIIVNYEHYRRIRDQEERRAYNRDAKRKERKSKNKPEPQTGKVKPHTIKNWDNEEIEANQNQVAEAYPHDAQYQKKLQERIEEFQDKQEAPPLKFKSINLNKPKTTEL